MSPRVRHLAATRRHHLPDDRRQHLARMFPADHVQTFAGFGDELERAAAIGEEPVGTATGIISATSA